MIHPFILSGGIGTRLWPLARAASPKQLLALQGKNSLLQNTALRIGPLGFAPSIVICAEEHRFQVAGQMRQIGVAPNAIVLEPVGRGTAPAAAIAALMIAQNDPDGVVLLLPSDHVIADDAAFIDAVRQATSVAQGENLIVTLGAIPDRVETGFGYIRAGDPIDGYSGARSVVEFVEKPDATRAAKLLRDRDYFWNCGIFAFRARTMVAEFEKFAPDILQVCKQALEAATGAMDFVRLDKDVFKKLHGASLDVAVMERTKLAAIIPSDMGWHDAGSWSSIWSLQTRDQDGNALCGDAIALNTKNSLVYSEDVLTTVVGLENVVVVSTGDAVLVAGKDSAQSVASLVAKLKEDHRTEVSEHKTVQRPWGSYRSILSGAGFQAKEIVVKPGGRLSLQMHHKRAEHWIVVGGVARVTCDDKVFDLRTNESTFIPLGAKHRLENLGDEPLCLIEVQCGSYLGEDDIVRFEDVYGRAKPGV